MSLLLGIHNLFRTHLRFLNYVILLQRPEQCCNTKCSADGKDSSKIVLSHKILLWLIKGFKTKNISVSNYKHKIKSNDFLVLHSKNQG